MKVLNKKGMFHLIIIAISLFAFGLPALTFSAVARLTPEALPGSVQPGLLGKQLQPRRLETPQAQAPIQRPQEKAANSLGEQANKIKFQLNEIILIDNHVFSKKQLQEIYKDKLHKVITVAELQNIVQNITNFYRNNGYILSRAIIPPQHVANGVVKVRILEGYIAKVHVIGHPKGAKQIVQAYGNRISDSRPLKLSVMEHYLLLGNELPGVQVKAILEPSLTQTAASDLNLATETKLLTAFLSYDNYGTRYIGPQQITGSVGANSIFRSGDVTNVTYVTTSKGNELKYTDLMHETPLGSSGLRLALDANQSKTNPLFTLQDLQVFGNAVDYSTTLRYPLIRSRSENLTLETAFNYLNSKVDQLGTLLYFDRVRTVRFGGVYDFADRFRGSNTIVTNLVKGVTWFGGTSNDQSFYTSRYGATSQFLRVNLTASRLQSLFWRLSAFGLVRGQYSFEPLLSSEQFAFGGSQLGRGYDPAEITGDRGAGGTMELRLDTMPERFLIQFIQFYIFYDAGVTWNLRNVQNGVSTKQTAMSTGGGFRVTMNKYLSANFMIAQPLTRQVESLEQIGNGRLPRTFFSVVASI